MMQNHCADSLYKEAFEQWAEVFEEYPDLIDSPVADDVFAQANQYFKLIGYSNRKWRDFPLQKVVDEKARMGGPTGLPTSSQIKAMEQDEADAADDDLDSDSEDDASDEATPDDETTTSDDTAEPETDSEDSDSESDDS